MTYLGGIFKKISLKLTDLTRSRETSTTSRRLDLFLCMFLSVSEPSGEQVADVVKLSAFSYCFKFGRLFLYRSADYRNFVTRDVPRTINLHWLKIETEVSR